PASIRILSLVSVIMIGGAKLWKLLSLPKFPSLFFTTYPFLSGLQGILEEFLDDYTKFKAENHRACLHREILKDSNM
ncbi:MAG TPA: hypothetical protein PKE38_12750, partial [Ignavibacteriaceae bacterium]|nr:hypothetical protein [Ignavibacteriaceae bacterium]